MSTEVPSWTLDRATLVSLLDIIQSFPSTSPKPCSLKQEGEHLTFTSSTREYFVQADVSILNTENRLEYEAEVHFSFVMLRFLVQNNSVFSLVVKNSQLYFVAEGFQVKVDTYSLSPLISSLEPPTKAPKTPFFPKPFLDSVQLFFSRTSNIVENKVLVDGLSAACAFTEYVARAEMAPSTEEGSELSTFGHFYLRRTDIPALQAFRAMAKGQGFFDYYKQDKRIWAHHGDFWMSFLVLPDNSSQNVEVLAMDRIQDREPLEISLPRLKTALSTLSFLKVTNAVLFEKEGTIRVNSPQAQFVVGRGKVADFSVNIERVLGFVSAIPAALETPVQFSKSKASLVLEYQHQGMTALFSVANDASQSRSPSKPVEKAPQRTPQVTPGVMGPELQALQKKA